MKEDILEQLVDDYLQVKGYFTRHNLKFRPRPDHADFKKREDSNHSDIDVLGVHPKRSGRDRVWVVSCKSWQSGFDARSKLNEITENKIRSGRESWKFFRELRRGKWSEAFVDAIQEHTGQREFTYLLAVTRLKGDRRLWEERPEFREALGGNPLRFLPLEEMIGEVYPEMGTTVASSQLGRTLQLVRASGGKVLWQTGNSEDEANTALAAGGRPLRKRR